MRAVAPILIITFIIGWIMGLIAWNLFLAGVLIFLAIFTIILSVRIVSPQTVRTVEFFGRFNRLLRPWLNFIIPFAETTIQQILYRKNFAVDVEWVTHDNVTAYIWLNVIYFVKDDEDDSRTGNIYKSVYSIDDPRTMMRAAIDEQLRAMMVSFTHKNIFEKREEIGKAIEERLREKLKEFGYTLDSIQVRDVKLDSTVMHAMNKVVETEKFKEAALNEAEAKKIMQVKEAEAEMESKILLGQGMAGQRLKIAEWFKESIDMIKWADKSLNAKWILDFLLDSSRIETLWNIGKDGNSKLIYLNEDLEWKTSKARNEKLISGSDIM